MATLKVLILAIYYGHSACESWRRLDCQYWQDTTAKLCLSKLTRYYGED